MKKVIDKNSLEIIKDSNPLGVGKEGICFLLQDNNKVVKIFHEFYELNQINFDNIKNNHIAFPIDTLYNNKDKLVGYTMNYLAGEKFIQGFNEELYLQELKSAYLNLRIIILKLKDIYMDDNCLENMLYDYKSNKINLIDTSRWYKKTDGHMESINEFNWQMINALLRNIEWKSYKLNRDKKLYELFISYKYLEQISSLFIEFLNELEIKVSEYKGYKVKTIKDLIIK